MPASFNENEYILWTSNLVRRLRRGSNHFVSFRILFFPSFVRFVTLILSALANWWAYWDWLHCERSLRGKKTRRIKRSEGTWKVIWEKTKIEKKPEIKQNTRAKKPAKIKRDCIVLAKLEKGKCLWHMGYSTHTFYFVNFFFPFAMAHRLNFFLVPPSLFLFTPHTIPYHIREFGSHRGIVFRWYRLVCNVCILSVVFLALLRGQNKVDCNFTWVHTIRCHPVRFKLWRCAIQFVRYSNDESIDRARFISTVVHSIRI